MSDLGVGQLMSRKSIPAPIISVGVGVMVGDGVRVGVTVAVRVGEGVSVGVREGVTEGLGVFVAVGTGDGNTVGVGFSAHADRVHKSIIRKKN